ncbi:MAG: hypothetical protein ACI9CF_001923 [Candidatus Omnitrophota bacterium]|jgi:uncharacterized protein (DUF3084 family)
MIISSTKSISLISLLLVSAFFLPGCDNLDESERELLKRDDPTFRSILEVKDQMTGQVDSLKSDLESKKKGMQARIDELKKSYDTEANTRQLQIAKLNEAIQATRDKFKTQFDTDNQLLEAKKKMIDELKTAYSNAKQVLGQQEALGLGQQEIGEWRARVENLKKRVEPLKAEITDLGAELALRKKKLKYL